MKPKISALISIFFMLLHISLIDTATADNSQPFGTVVGVLKGPKSVLKYKLKPFATKKVKVNGIDMWEVLLSNYRPVSPDETGKFTMSNVPVGIYSLYAIVREAKGPGGESLPVWEFMKNESGEVIKFKVKANDITDLGTINVILK